MHVVIDARKFDEIASVFDRAGKQAPVVISRALNEAGARTKTQVIRALTDQTKLKRATIVRAVKEKRAGYGDLTYELKTRGGDISLKYFDARETQGGVTARPKGQSKVYPRAFIKGGRFPNRVALKLGGHVFERAGAKRKPIEKRKSDVYIPREMVSGQTSAAFQATANSVLPRYLERHLRALLSGAAPKGRV